ncbi:MAG: ABC transporter permease [Armatimonadota bacterium]|nr:ABC transporter permease [Armatimonadota bacterium]MDR7402690.1 ABC transporter permease [Armatimonadota bacterium]MDR7437760.1 ABC transporter permease [Armatimonadota bacterium]MDR7473277.1 ABC transporter permease [Armatimonadota bacterium]MDR7506514.1 ABC transporter permease [Armatimonadota bacterium]
MEARRDSDGSEIGTWRHEVRAVFAVWLREVIRFTAERVRLVGALGQPLIYLVVMGTGVGATFRAAAAPAGFDYRTFIFPGVLGMTVLFTALFSAVSVIWDREFGFLKEILVAPVSRASIVLGKALGGATVAWVQGTLLLALTPLVGIQVAPGQLVRLWVVMFVMAFALTSLGLAIAARMSSMEGFQVVMNFLVVPMWLLSGAFFPLRGVPGWMATLMRVNPLTYGVDALRGVLYEGSALAAALVAHPYAADLTVVAGVAAVTCVAALAAFRPAEA